MSELTTADLAGGTARPRPSTTDPSASTYDSKLDPRDGDTRSMGDPRTMSDTATTSRDADFADPRENPVPATSHRTSQLANPAATDGAATSATPLFPTGDAEGFRSRWTEVQVGFVDEPRTAVEQADSLVAEMMKRLAQVFADERGKLEEQWSRGDDISTEDLRVALQRYRSFFDRLLQV
jgi:hypothetical protein